MKNVLRPFVICSLLFHLAGISPVNAQLNKLKDKLKQTKSATSSEKPVSVKNSETVAGKVEIVPTEAAGNSSKELSAIRKKYADGSMAIVSNEETKPSETSVPAYLTFTNDFSKPETDMAAFTGKDFVYAVLKLPKKLTDYLPAADAADLEYYRIVIKAWPDYDKYRDVESNLKLDKKSQFPLAFNTNIIPFGILPAQEFYDAFGDAYKKEDKFATPTDAVKGYSRILANPITFEIAEMLKNAPDGPQIIHVKVEITAKLKGSSFRKLDEIRGAFGVNLDAEARERYAGIVAAMGEYKLSNYYFEQLSIANQTISEAAEAEMLKNMSPRDRERYNIAKRSPDGYMAAYKGAKATCTFTMDNQRSSNAKIWISWPDGGEGKEAGNSSFNLFPGATRSKTKSIPVGATVTMNGRTLIPKVSGDQNVTIYWYY